MQASPLQRIEGVPAPAKLNLFLHVTGRRDDGYHLLQSVFMLVDWCDTLDFSLREDGCISREDSRPGLPAEDLCVRAAKALRQATGCALGAHIRLHKRLPAEAGLGGGSSDAAACLLALNRLWDLRLGRSELARIGLSLGADVPFFIGGHNAWVEGVGEQLTPIHLKKTRMVIVKPPTGASTAAIFASPKLQRNTKTATIQGFAANPNSGRAGSNSGIECDMQKILSFGHNDLQAAAQELCPDVGRCLNWLSSKGLNGRMTGSGSAVFAQLSEAVDLSDAPKGWLVHECDNMDAHPLVGWCTD